MASYVRGRATAKANLAAETSDAKLLADGYRALLARRDALQQDVNRLHLDRVKANAATRRALADATRYRREALAARQYRDTLLAEIERAGGTLGARRLADTVDQLISERFGKTA